MKVRKEVGVNRVRSLSLCLRGLKDKPWETHPQAVQVHKTAYSCSECSRDSILYRITWLPNSVHSLVSKKEHIVSKLIYARPHVKRWGDAYSFGFDKPTYFQ